MYAYLLRTLLRRHASGRGHDVGRIVGSAQYGSVVATSGVRAQVDSLSGVTLSCRANASVCHAESQNVFTKRHRAVERFVSVSNCVIKILLLLLSYKYDRAY